MNLELVDNNAKYFDFIRKLRSDDRVQHGFIEQVNISPQQQAEYMARYADRYFVCLADQEPCGYIGDIDGDIRIAVHPRFQRLGVGLYMLTKFLEKRPEVEARVKIDNEASLRLFRKAGFKEKFVVFAPPPSHE